jgi:3-isopropylmalate/(R)-2-methylmalate dehydratase large subunit
MPMTVAEKILARASGRSEVRAGEVVEPRVDVALSHENAALVIGLFQRVFEGTGRRPVVWDASKIVIVFDHRAPAESSKTATDQRKVREFVTAQGIQRFHDIRGDVGGICHQVLPENGYVRPGAVVVGTDFHTTSHGALGSFAINVGAAEMATVWALGKALDVEVPPTIRVEVAGRLRPHVGAKDLILQIVGRLGADGAGGRVIEFHGPAIREMSIAGRLVLCNVAAEAGATSAIVPADEETVRYLRGEAGVTDPILPVLPDPDAVYERQFTIDATTLGPLVACPHAVDNVQPVEAVEGTRVHQVVIGSCTNGRLEDIAAAVRIVRGRQVAPGTRLLVFPASSRIFRQALERGYVAQLMRAGAVVMNSGCGCCLGLHEGTLGDGEVALSTTNRNFRGRMGNPNSEIYLCSPEVAAASAVSGFISDPRRVA